MIRRHGAMEPYESEAVEGVRAFGRLELCRVEVIWVVLNVEAWAL